jgi:hypothetical protein
MPSFPQRRIADPMTQYVPGLRFPRVGCESPRRLSLHSGYRDLLHTLWICQEKQDEGSIHWLRDQPPKPAQHCDSANDEQAMRQSRPPVLQE